MAIQTGTYTRALMEEARASGKYPLCKNEHCRRPMRPGKSYAEMHPGAVRAGRDGMCSTCTYPKKKSAPKKLAADSPYEPLTSAERTRHNRMNLVTYMQSRGRSAGLKPEHQLV